MSTAPLTIKKDTSTTLTPLLAKAYMIAAIAFENKVDKGGHPYIEHCHRVAMKCRSTLSKIVALLHDIPEDFEDTNISLQDIDNMGFPVEVLIPLALLTHKKEDPYDEYIRGISGHPIAREVKVADLEDNSNITRLKGLTKKDFDRMEKYHKAYVYLSKI